MIRGNRIFAGLLLALSVVGALSGAAAIADEGVTEGAQEQSEVLEELPVVQLVEDEGEKVETSRPAEDADEIVAPRPRPARAGDRGRSATTASSSAQPEPEGQGQVEIDPESTEGACPGGTALKIDNLRSNGTYGPITISDFTNTSFTWTSTEGVSAVLVKDGGGYKTNPGGTTGSASSLGQDISHVIFCLGGDVPEVDVEEPCDADETTPDTEPCEPEPCDADETTPDTEPCEPEPCDADETMPGTQPCAPTACDADENMSGRQDCTKGVSDSEPKPEKRVDEGEVQAAALTGDRAPDVAPMAAQPAVQGSVLPLTGGQLAGFVTIAAGFLTAGGGALLIRRR